MDGATLFASRREVLAAIASIAVGGAGAGESAVAAPVIPGASDFDFLHGAWAVRHRKLTRRLAGSSTWVEFPGALNVRPILGGSGNIDENVLEDPAGHYLATSIRLFDPKTGLWSIYWADGRVAGLDAPVVGRFEGRLGRFFLNDTFEGRPIRVRTTYEDQGAGRAQWTQSFSPDAGESWEINWIMDFSREAQA